MPDLIDQVSPYRRCAVVSKANGEDPIGTATPADAFLLVEQALPWTRKVEGSRRFPQAVVAAVDRERERGRRVRLLAIAPDRALSRPGLTRLLFCRRPPSPFAAFEREEYLAPTNEIGPLVEALLAGPARPAPFAPFRQPEEGCRDILVCTHGTRDACCGTLGFPAFVALRRLAADRPATKLRVWRASHLGGHRFAPTLLDLPEGRMWGHLGQAELETLAQRQGEIAALRRCYRGWAALDGPFLQAAERELFAREGWGWTTRSVVGSVLAVDPDRETADVRIDTFAPDGRPVAGYEATVDGSGRVSTLGSSGSDDLEAMAQYRVRRLVDRPPPAALGVGASIPTPN